MKSVIMKFGGTSLGNGKKIKRVAKMLRDKRASETVVVISAMSGLTDSLITIGNTVVKGVSEDEIHTLVEDIRNRHITTVKQAMPTEFQSFVIAEIEKMCSELEKVDRKSVV